MSHTPDGYTLTELRWALRDARDELRILELRHLRRPLGEASDAGPLLEDIAYAREVVAALEAECRRRGLDTSSS